MNKALKKELSDARMQFRKERHKNPGDPLAQAWKDADDVEKGPAREAAKQLIIQKWQEAKDPNRHDKEGAWKCVRRLQQRNLNMVSERSRLRFYRLFARSNRTL